MPKGKYFMYALFLLSLSMFNIMTTNKNKVMTAPTYTSNKMSDKNSARSIIQIAAIAKKVMTSDKTLRTGLRTVITEMAEQTASVANK